MEAESLSHGIIFIPLSSQLSTVTDAVASIEFRKDINQSQSINLHSLPVVTLSQNGSQTVSELKPEAETESIPSEGLAPIESVSILANEKESSQKMRHNPDKTKGCPIPTCSRYQRAFSRTHDLKRHIARHQTKLQRNFEPPPSDVRTCGQCGDHFLNDLILQRHINTTHSTKSAINNNNNNNNNPTNNNNQEDDEYSCNICELKFDNFDQLNSHAVIHKKSSESKCRTCGVNFQNEETLANHMKQHSPEQSSPDLEPKEKLDDFLLEELLLLKNPRVPTKSCNKNQKSSAEKEKIQCGYCAKTFKTQWTLNTHVAAHEGRYQFACSICNKKFVRKSHYSSHLRSHEAARPFVCDHCGKAFKELKHRREHVKRTHSNNNNRNSNDNKNNINNRNAIQNLLDSISASVIDEDSIIYDQPKLTLLMPMNFST